MSLKVWLPLIDNINNQGLETVSIENNGATVDSSGKLGSCYSFNGTSNNIVTSYPSYESDFSVCIWAYFTKLNIHLLDMRNSDGTGYQPMYINSSSGIQVGGTGSAFTYIPYTFSLNTWYHICVTANSLKTVVYINGQNIGETTNSKGINYNTSLQVTIGSRYSDSNWFGGKVNDFRIYNHFLSAKEVKEISQGLVLHYKLDTIATNPNTGEFYIPDSSGYGKNGIIYGTVTTSSDSSRYNNSLIFNGTDSRICYDNFSIGNNWSYGAWVYSAKSSRGWEGIVILNNSSGDSDIQLGTYVHPTGNNIQSSANGQYDTSISLTYGQWNHIFATFDGTNLKTYINGTLSKTKTITNSLLSRAHLTVGARSNSSSGAGSAFTGAFLGNISDVRIYSTVFTPEEVLDLYHTPANIDNLGDIHSFEFNEVETTNLSDFSLNSSNWVSDGVTATYITEHNIGDIVKMVPSSGNKRIYHYVSDVWTSGKVYLVSLWAKADSSGAVIRPSRSIADWATPNFNLTTEWKQYYGIINCTTTATGGTLSISYSGSTNIPCYISHIKLEEANKNLVSILKTGVFKENWIDEENFTINAKILKRESVIVGREFIEK